MCMMPDTEGNNGPQNPGQAFICKTLLLVLSYTLNLLRTIL